VTDISLMDQRREHPRCRSRGLQVHVFEPQFCRR
jgi:hypothetical protein